MIEEKWFRSESPRANYPDKKPEEIYKIDDPALAINPWHNFPRNQACPCGSGRKWKSCHDRVITPAIEKYKVEKIRAIIREVLGAV